MGGQISLVQGMNAVTWVFVCDCGKSITDNVSMKKAIRGFLATVLNEKRLESGSKIANYNCIHPCLWT